MTLTLQTYCILLAPSATVNQHYWANISCNQPIKRKKVCLIQGKTRCLLDLKEIRERNERQVPLQTHSKWTVQEKRKEGENA